MKINSTTCYMCDNTAVSKEHAPPRCLFPKESKYRTNLITVPSCKEHNQELSHADQILLNILLSQPIIENEPFKILNDQYLNKNSTNFNRKLNSYAKQVKSVKPINLIDKQNGTLVTYGIVEYEQTALVIYESIMKLCCALYFNDYQKKLTGSMYVNLDIRVLDKNEYKQTQEMFNLSQKLFETLNVNFKGDVPEVFQYRICEYRSSTQEVVIEFLFYEKIRGIFKHMNK